jgi:hypothetical protein
MLSAAAFVCSRSHRIPVRRIQLTRELKAFLVFLRLAGMADEPLNFEPTTDQSICDGEEQELHLSYSSPADIVVPLARHSERGSLRAANAPSPPRGFGISIHDRITLATKATTRDYWSDLEGAFLLLNRLAFVADQIYQFRGSVEHPGLFQEDRAHDPVPFLLLDQMDDIFATRPPRSIRIISAARTRALLLVEPLPGDKESRVRLYSPN